MLLYLILAITKVTSETQQNTLQRSLQTQEKTAPPQTGFGDTNELDALVFYCKDISISYMVLIKPFQEHL